MIIYPPSLRDADDSLSRELFARAATVADKMNEHPSMKGSATPQETFEWKMGERVRCLENRMAATQRALMQVVDIANELKEG